jgi:hypothetical protein
MIWAGIVFEGDEPGQGLDERLRMWEIEIDKHIHEDGGKTGAGVPRPGSMTTRARQCQEHAGLWVAGFKAQHLWRQDKGQDACAAAFVDSIRRGGPSPIPFHELMEVGRTTIELANSL